MKKLLFLLIYVSSLFAQVAPLPQSKPQFFTKTGLVCAGCKLSTVATGTASPLATFTDSSGLVQNPNPIIMGSDGRPPQEIWLGPFAYDITLKDASNAIVYTVKNVSVPNIQALTQVSITVMGPIIASSATPGIISSSSVIEWDALYSNGTSILTDKFQCSNVPGIVANPAMILTCVHSGSSGAASMALGFSLGIKGPNPWVDITAFGALGDGTTDNTVAIQNAINFACTGLITAPSNATCTTSTDVLVPSGTYKILGCLQTYGLINIIGAGRFSSIIAKGNNAVCTAGLIVAPNRALNDNYNAVDAILAVVHPPSAYASHWGITGIQLKNSTGSPSTAGVYSPRSSQFEISNSYINNVTNGFFANDNFLATIRHTTVDTASFGYKWGDDGSGLSTGTSVTLDNVWATNITNRCYDMTDLNDSSWNNTSCDNYDVTNLDLPLADIGNAAYSFTSSVGISIRGMGGNVIHGAFLSLQGSRISVSGARTFSVTGYASASGNPSYIFSSNSFFTVDSSDFQAMTSPGSFSNTNIQTNSIWVVTNTNLPTGGSTSIPYSGTSLQINSSATGVVLTNLAGTSKLTPTSLGFTNLLLSGSSPTIAAGGCGGSAAGIVNNNGTASFSVGVGATPLSNCTVTLPTAVNGWNCWGTDITTASTSLFVQKQTAGTTTTAVISNFNTAGAAVSYTPSDVLQISCFAR